MKPVTTVRSKSVDIDRMHVKGKRTVHVDGNTACMPVGGGDFFCLHLEISSPVPAARQGSWRSEPAARRFFALARQSAQELLKSAKCACPRSIA